MKKEKYVLLRKDTFEWQEVPKEEYYRVIELYSRSRYYRAINLYSGSNKEFVPGNYCKRTFNVNGDDVYSIITSDVSPSELQDLFDTLYSE